MMRMVACATAKKNGGEKSGRRVAADLRSEPYLSCSFS